MVYKLSAEERAGIQIIGAMLLKLSKIIGTDGLNEIRFYDEQLAEKAASVSAKSKAATDKSNIEKFL